MKKPKLIKNPDLSGVIEQVKEYMKEVSKGYVDDDTEHYLFEAVLEAFYGENVWEWHNKKIK